MKKLLYGGLLTSILISCVKQPADPSIYGETITSSELKELLYTYASDEFEGRETGEPGQKMAVNFLKEKYLSMDISSAIGNDDYFQKVPLERQLLPEVSFVINGIEMGNYEDFVPPRNVDIPILNIKEIVYAGYGIDTETYSDYQNLDVKDKYVFIKAGEPMNEDGIYVTTGSKEKSQWTEGRRARRLKIQTAQDKGAKAVFVWDEPANNYYSKVFKELDQGSIRVRVAAISNADDPYSFIINQKLAEQVISDIVINDEPRIQKTNIELSIKKNADKFESENVVAFMEGEEKPNEIVVISAHLDHIGIQDDGGIANGADDDGSGTVAVLEIAQAFKKAAEDGYRPKRSILFLHFTGEEKGLLGSRFYADVDPIFPLENTVANLNIDMIGRVDKFHEENRNYVYVIGADMLSSDLYEISEKANKTYTNIELDYRYNNETDPNRFYYRSDHYNFAKNNIPVIFYFNGTHEDYHQVTDTPDKIQYDLLEMRTRLVFYTAWELVNRDERIVVDKVAK